jgi:hypothetical protein
VLTSALILLAAFLWSAAIISQSIAVALIAAISSLASTFMVTRVHATAKENARKIDDSTRVLREVSAARRIVITHTDRGLLITDEDDPRELQPRADWDWPSGD